MEPGNGWGVAYSQCKGHAEDGQIPVGPARAGRDFARSYRQRITVIPMVFDAYINAALQPVADPRHHRTLKVGRIAVATVICRGVVVANVRRPLGRALIPDLHVISPGVHSP